ncbi:hypothetical protein ACFLZP_00295 [Patescibacteria group bacterium]
MKLGIRILIIGLIALVAYILPANLTDQIGTKPAVLIFLGVLFTYLVSYLGRSRAWWLGGLIGGLFGWIINKFSGLFFLSILGLLLDFILSKNYRRWRLEHKATSWRKTWGGFYAGKPKFKFGGGLGGGGGATGNF